MRVKGRAVLRRIATFIVAAAAVAILLVLMRPLNERFGEAYLAYKAEVSQLLPRLKR